LIPLIELKDIQNLFTKVEELNERTKRHTKQIKELQNELKKIKRDK